VQVFTAIEEAAGHPCRPRHEIGIRELPLGGDDGEPARLSIRTLYERKGQDVMGRVE
jgi:hypothetical protein